MSCDSKSPARNQIAQWGITKRNVPTVKRWALHGRVKKKNKRDKTGMRRQKNKNNNH
jgi:hypothetical protein